MHNYLITGLNRLFLLQAGGLYAARRPGLPVVRPADIETTARGAMLAAGVGVGVLTPESIFTKAGIPEAPEAGSTRFEPSINAEARRARNSRWANAIERSLGWERPL